MALEYHFVLPPTGQADNSIVREMFDDVKAYVDNLVPSGSAAPIDAHYVTLTTNATLTQERVLTAGTAINLTDNGAGSTVVVTNTGVTSIVAGTGISISSGTGAVTITNTNPTGANNALSNLASIAINLSLLPGSSDTISLGSASEFWQDVFVGRDVVFHKTGDLSTVLLLKAPSSFSAWTLTLPTTAGTNTYLLQTDGSGTTSWTPPFDSSGLADVALDNLSGVAINTSLLPGTDDAINLGSNVKIWDQIWSKSVTFRSAGIASNILTLKAPGTMSGDYTFTFPDTGGTNTYVLQTNGSGVTSWIAPSTFATGATRALDNLLSVAINTSLLPASDNSINLGSTSKALSNIYGVSIEAGRSGLAGVFDVFPPTASKGQFSITAADNSGNTTTSFTVASQSGGRVYNLADVGGNADFVMTAGSQTVGGAKTLSSALTVTPTTSQLVLGTTRTITLSATQPATSSRVYTFPDAGADANVILSESAQTINGVKTFGTPIAVGSGGTGQSSYTDGQLLIGNTTGNTLAKATLTGTTHQVIVTNGSGSITLSTPQNIDTSSSPTFAGATLSAALAMGANKITGLASGTVSTDAASFGQLEVIQVVTATNTTNFTTTSNTYQTTNLSVAITPTSSSNRILIFAVGAIGSAAIQTATALASIFRGSTDVLSAAGTSSMTTTTVTGNNATPCALMGIDSPATTSSTTYSVKLKNTDNATTVAFGKGNMTVIVAVEVV